MNVDQDMDVEENDTSISISGASLAARVYRPKQPSRVLAACAFAVIAHPWGMLGGSMIDHVVITLANAFLTSNPPIPVITYSSRGVFPSTGRASWWGCEVEKRDYERVVEWGMSRIGWLNGVGEEPVGEEGDGEEMNAETTIYCCGYSHGSLLAPFTPSALSSTSTHYRYILVSPPLGVAWFLHPFKGSSYDLALRRAMEREWGHEAIMVLHTTNDQFTSSSTYATWTRKMESISTEVAISGDAGVETTKLFADVEVETDHFWGSNAARNKLVTSVHEWLR